MRACIFLAATASFSIVLLEAFKWSIIDRITPLFHAPLAAAVWLFFAGTAITGLVCMFRYRQIWPVAFYPSIIMATALLIVYLTPFNDLWLEANFLLYKKEREEIVKRIYENELRPNVAHNPLLIDLGKSYPPVSMGGNQLIVHERTEGVYVLFFTFRGIGGNYSGFVHVPERVDSGNITDIEGRRPAQVIRMDKNWYYVSYH